MNLKDWIIENHPNVWLEWHYEQIKKKEEKE